jgi:hypothetical protein
MIHDSDIPDSLTSKATRAKGKVEIEKKTKKHEPQVVAAKTGSHLMVNARKQQILQASIQIGDL